MKIKDSHKEVIQDLQAEFVAMEMKRKTLKDKPNNDEITFIESADLQLLDCDEVEATAIDWKIEDFKRWNQRKLVLTYLVHRPERYEGVQLSQYIVLRPDPGPNSK